MNFINHMLLIFITIPNHCINFNVHPNKKEVHFKNNNAIYTAVYSVICDLLSSNDPSERRNKLIFSNSKLGHGSKTEIKREVDLNSLTKNYSVSKTRTSFFQPVTFRRNKPK